MRVKDDNYFIAGTAYKGDDRDVWVSVQNREGNPTLANDFIFGTDDYLEEAADVLILEDNSFLILGSTTNIDENKWKGVVDANDSTDILLLKVNSQGNLLWRKRLGYGGKDVGVKIEKMENGNFAILGNSKIGTDFEIFIALLNPDGNVYNTRNLKPGRQNKALGLDYKNGLLSLSGSADGVAYLESLDQSLNTQSEFSANSIFSTEISSEINSVISTEEGTLLITATWSKENREKDASVLLLGANGKKIWQDPLFFGSEEDDQSVMALPLDQDKYLLLGNFKFGSNTMMGLLKISEIGLK
ncbi:MAG: hypothetical protein R8P61_08185 [Bacteroidia bacterium]|nr:hypothetical protein [Bacteroidia bacterium]